MAKAGPRRSLRSYGPLLTSSSMMLVILIILFGAALAQRPSNASICDYYAISLYGTNTTDSQTKLMQHVVSLAFGGGANLPNASSDLTGILNPGTFNGLNVDLQPWFNGSIDSTNLNNQAVGINWLDDGGVKPLYDYLSGATPTVVLANTTNEYRLFSHFFSAFSHVFGCTQPGPSPPSTGGQTLSLAYVHKYMNLNYTDLGHFIDQLGKSTQYFGFSDQDSNTLVTQLNAQYNVRCAPPVTLNPAQGPQLYSLCQDPSCPLAEPSPDCAAYVNLGPSGIGSGAASSQTSTATSSSSASFTTISSSTPTTSQTQTTVTTGTPSAVSTIPASSSSKLSPGAIAGVSIGGAAVVFIFIGALIFLLRRRRPVPETPYIPNPSYVAPSYTDQHTSYTSHGEHWSPPIAEMESPRFGLSPEMANTPHETRL